MRGEWPDLGLPFRHAPYLLTDREIKRSPIQTSRLILSTMVTSWDATTTMDIGWPLRCSCRPRMEQCVLLFLFWCLQQGGGTQNYFIFICTENILRSRIKWRLEWQNHKINIRIIRTSFHLQSRTPNFRSSDYCNITFQGSSKTTNATINYHHVPLLLRQRRSLHAQVLPTRKNPSIRGR